MIRLVPSNRLAAAGRTAPSFDLTRIELVEINARQLAPLTAETPPSMALRFADEVLPDPITDAKKLSAVVHLTLSSVKDGESSAPGFFEIDLRIRVTFSKLADVTVPDADADAFLSLNGLYAAWPYLRELLATTANRMGYPPFVLDPLVIRAEPPPAAPPARAPAPKSDTK